MQIGDALFGQYVGDVIGVHHDRRQGEVGFFRQFPGVQLVDESGLALLAEGFLHLHHQTFAARHIANQLLLGGLELFAAFQPGLRCMTAAFGVAAHIRRAAKA